MSSQLQLEEEKCDEAESKDGQVEKQVLLLLLFLTDFTLIF